jgi:DNA-3-methyladenine glycosylase I
MGDTVVCEDGLARCGWGVSPPVNRDYHDQEWGRAVTDERSVFETLCLEGFQSGLSWITILRKREAFRAAFASFDPDQVAVFGEADVERIMADPGVVRHRGKIMATIGNARATVELRRTGSSLPELMWRFRPVGGSPPAASADVPVSSAESQALSAELRRQGFKFVGPTTVYAAMQALGLVDDHLVGCHFRGGSPL